MLALIALGLYIVGAIAWFAAIELLCWIGRIMRLELKEASLSARIKDALLWPLYLLRA
jgi:prepilin signal peptidase PulO-like enzyme (type II secretory pathway)